MHKSHFAGQNVGHQHAEKTSNNPTTTQGKAARPIMQEAGPNECLGLEPSTGVKRLVQREEFFSRTVQGKYVMNRFAGNPEAKK